MNATMMPIITQSSSDSSTAAVTDIPCCISINAITHDPAMIATSRRLMPRLITISPIPSPRMPRMEMPRSKLITLETAANPFSAKPNTTSRATVIRSTICSWLGALRKMGMRLVTSAERPRDAEGHCTDSSLDFARRYDEATSRTTATSE